MGFCGRSAGTALFGPGLCYYLCPLGSLQEWIGGFGRRVFKRRYNRFVPKKADRALGYFRYAVLALIVFQTTRLVSLAFSRFDPYYALFRFWSGEVYASALIVLGAVLAASLFMERPWCRWLCPLGRLLGLVQLAAPWKIRVTKGSCTSCGACLSACSGRRKTHRPRRAGDSAPEETAGNGPAEHSLPFNMRLSMKSGLAAGILFLAIFIAPSPYAIVAGKMVRPGQRSGVQDAPAERALDKDRRFM